MIQQLWERLLPKSFTRCVWAKISPTSSCRLSSRVIWVRSADVKLFDLVKTAISWEYVDSKKTKSDWKKIRILNIAKLVSAEFQVTKAFANLELNVCESKFNDNHLVEVSKTCNRLRILNISGCDITDFGMENTSLQSLIFINISNCKMLAERSNSCIIENWETISFCVKGLNLSVVQFQELYGDDMERKCRYCHETLFLTWTDVTGIDSLSMLIMWSCWHSKCWFGVDWLVFKKYWRTECYTGDLELRDFGKTARLLFVLCYSQFVLWEL